MVPPAKLRVAFGSVPKDGGTFTFYRTLRPALREHGIDLRCVSVGRDQAALTDLAFADEGCVQLAPHATGLKDQARAVCDWCADERIDIVFGVNSPAILSAIPHLPEGIRVMARCANGFDEGYRLTLVGRERLSRIVALVPRLRDDLIASYGVDPTRIALIPNCASSVRFDAAAARPRGAAERLELGFLGRLEHVQKGVLHLPAVTEALDRAGVRYRLTIAGRGRDEDRLREALSPALAEGRVRFAGPLPPGQIASFLGEIDVFLFPSHFEGCPNALLEAMMAGAVPVAWYLPGITDFLIEDGTTGCLAEIGNSEKFAAKIEQLAADRSQLARMSRAVGGAVRKRFSREACVRAYVELFRSVMSEPAPEWRPVPWSEFKPDPLFRQHPLARIMPTKQRQVLRTQFARLLGRSPSPLPAPAPPRVFQVINSIDMRRGGAERMARTLHDECRSAGIESQLIAIEPFGDGPVPEGALSLNLPSPYDPRALPRLAAMAGRMKPGDVVHAHLFPTSLYFSLLSRSGLLKAPMVFTEHSTSNKRRSGVLGRVIDSQVYGSFEQVVAISQGVMSELQKTRPWVKEVTVIANGCRLPFRTPVARDPRSGPLTLLSVGRLSSAKNYDGVLEAIALLMPCELRYIIAGEGAELEPLKHTAARLGLSDVVSFLGYVPDIRDILRTSDVFIMPSRWEGFGLAAVEAMNAGLPVIASDVPGLSEVVGADGKAAILIDPERPDQIASAISQLIESPALRAELGQAGFERSKSYDYHEFVQAHMHLYAKVRHEHGVEIA